MLLLNLTVDSFGVFRGKHSFDLVPYTEHGRTRHLTVFSGHNGAGKTTLFQALMLALHGSAYLGNWPTHQQYNNFILNRMHRSSDDEKNLKASDHSSVTLCFQYVRSGQYFTIQVERQWQRRGRSLQETLTVLQNGRPPEIDPVDYQTWIDEFISPEFGYLCFFDAEQLDTLANPDQQNKVLRETLDSLLGLDRVQRLQGDLEQFISRQGSTAKIDQLYTRVLELRSVVDELEDQLTYLRKELEEVNADLSSCDSALAQQERLLAAEGGAYAAKRPLLQSRLHTIQKEAETLSGQLRDLCGDLLPFALVPELCLQLSKRLATEIEIRHKKIMGSLWQEKLPAIEATLLTDDIWEGLGIPPGSQKSLAERLMEKLKTFGGETQSTQEVDIVHHLAEPEQQQLRKWISQAISTIPQQVQSLGERLRSLKEEQRSIEIDLQRAPDDAALEPIHAEIARLRGIISTRQKRQDALNLQIGSLQFQRDDKYRSLTTAVEQYEKARKVEKQLSLAERSRLVLRTYKDALTHQKLQTLEEVLVVCFNKICRKENLLARVSINPEDFSIQLESIDGNVLSLSSFSAGERQLYALAILWALRLISRRPLPLVVDTPLARLDEMHRLRFVHDYMPKVSDQVLLFTTDAELDTNLIAQVEPYLARVYRLTHDTERGETTCTCESPLALQSSVPLM